MQEYMKKFPKKIFSGYWGGCHCQGIAVDEKKGFIYYSFTTKLVKSDLNGNVIGTVDGLIGHLGCIDFNENDGKVYGSLEFKNDIIGKGILQKLGITEATEDAFYIAIFDVDKIDRMDMSAEKDGIMRAVYLREVVADFKGKGEDGFDHRYGCSGIDGTGFGPIPGGKDKKNYLNVCYGVYGTTEREDNDYQVILSFDASKWWDKYGQPLNQRSMHAYGPEKPDFKHFVYTGSTNWGVQNFEYDAYTGDYIMAVYKGKKPAFPNFNMYILDGKIAPKTGKHKKTGEDIAELFIKKQGLFEGEIYGNRFPYGSTGTYAFGNGYYYFSQNAHDDEKGEYTNVVLYKATGNPSDPFEEVE